MSDTDNLSAKLISPSSRSTTRSEWALIGIIVIFSILISGFIFTLMLPHWPAMTASQIIWFLGWGMLTSLGGLILLVIAFMILSGINHISASVLGAKVDASTSASSTPSVTDTTN